MGWKFPACAQVVGGGRLIHLAAQLGRFRVFGQPAIFPVWQERNKRDLELTGVADLPHEGAIGRVTEGNISAVRLWMWIVKIVHHGDREVGRGALRGGVCVASEGGLAFEDVGIPE